MTTPKSLKRLLDDWRTAVHDTHHPHPPDYTGPDAAVTGFSEDTRKLAPGDCFVARVRNTSDGHQWIPQAIEQGAAAVLAERTPAELGLTMPEGVVYLQVEDTAVALAWLAAAWEEFPSRRLVTIGVTGTDGKTSTANLLHAVLQAAGLRVGLLSTIKAAIGGSEELLELHVTTPEAPVVQRYLRRMVDAGLTHCILEATSHGLAQHRVTAVDFDLALVTNITHEHLDYHGSYEAYLAAKSRLFEALTLDDWAIPAQKPAVPKTAILNRDDASYEPLHRIPAPHTLTYAIRAEADVTAAAVRHTAAAARFELHLPHTAVPVATPLVGEFNIYNMLAAAAAAHTLGVSAAAVQTGLEAVRGIDGRMQRIDRGQPFQVIVDFAHTPVSLERAIAAARRLTDGRVITVFGSAGKRDVAKRRLMADAAARRADLAILTAEDPRTDSLDEILDTMADACRAADGREGETFRRIPDRGRAIYFALTQAGPDDLVLICGKGHEQSMCFGVTEYPWDDREATRTALDAFLDGRPMPDLGLPTFA